jgi:hypothetical protein
MLSNSNPNPSTSSSVHPAANQPQREEGVALDELQVGAVIEVVTGHNTYRFENRGDGKVLMTGHPEYCPQPLLVDLLGSIGPSQAMRMWFLEPGMKMMFRHPRFGVVCTSRIQEVRNLKGTLAN